MFEEINWDHQAPSTNMSSSITWTVEVDEAIN